MRILIVDLNNFARYPTLSVGYLTALLRRAGAKVDVYSPLAIGVRGVVRERRTPPWGLVEQRLRFSSAASSNPLVHRVRDALRRRFGTPELTREIDRVSAEVESRLDQGPDAMLVSTYLMYYPHVRRLCRAASSRGIPVLIGGPYFAQPEVARAWLGLAGLSGLVTGEVELQLSAIVKALVAGDPIEGFAGVVTPAGAEAAPARPLEALDALPFPDFADFPWRRYPNRIVPVLAGRGCGWGVCTFCSDVTSTAGRTFRGRDAAAVMEEMVAQARRYGTRSFVFTDLKLNSDLAMWGALGERLPSALPRAVWIGSVHVDTREQNGLGRASLERASAAGLVRLTTGLESGSQRLLDAMCKGTDLGLTSRVLKDAARAGISVRVTMILGYPGETADDLGETQRFLEAHTDCIERVNLNRLAIVMGTRLHRDLTLGVRREELELGDCDPQQAIVAHRNPMFRDRGYRRAVHGVLAAVHRINRRPLAPRARDFEGVM